MQVPGVKMHAQPIIPVEKLQFDAATAAEQSQSSEFAPLGGLMSFILLGAQNRISFILCDEDAVKVSEFKSVIGLGRS